MELYTEALHVDATKLLATTSPKMTPFFQGSSSSTVWAGSEAVSLEDRKKTGSPLLQNKY